VKQPDHLVHLPTKQLRPTNNLLLQPKTTPTWRRITTKMWQTRQKTHPKSQAKEVALVDGATAALVPVAAADARTMSVHTVDVVVLAGLGDLTDIITLTATVQEVQEVPMVAPTVAHGAVSHQVSAC